MITGVTEIAHITTKQDMSRWCRAHAEEPGIHWSVFPGPNGTMIIVEHAEDRCSGGEEGASPGAISPDVVSFETVSLGSGAPTAAAAEPAGASA